MKIYDPVSGKRPQLSYSPATNEWTRVDLSPLDLWIRNWVPHCILEWFNPTLAHTQMSFLYSHRWTMKFPAQEADRNSAMLRVNEIFGGRLFFIVPHKKESPSESSSLEEDSFKVRGMIRSGNNCYLVSAMQILINNRYFCAKVCETILKEENGVLFAFYEVMLAYKYGASDEQVEELLNEFKVMLFTTQKFAFDFDAQQDITEVLNTMYDLIGASFVMKESVAGQPEKQVPYTHLDVGMSEGSSLKEFLDSYFGTEILTDYRDEVTQQVIPAEKKLELLELPDVIPISLNRFAYEQCAEKKSDEIAAAQEIDFAPYLASEVREKYAGATVYEIVELVHQKGCANSGHYSAEIRDRDGNWVRVNDLHVKPITQPAYGKAYGFILQRKPAQRISATDHHLFL